MARLEHQYNREGDHYLIELRLTAINQLISPLDPAPFRQKDLNPDAEAYLIESAREFPLATPLKIVIHLDGADESSRGEVIEAIHHYFAYRAEASKKRLLEKLREGRTSLIFGLLFLIFCLSARAAIGEPHPGSVLEILSEGLLISGWVAMWLPIQIFLYDWWPIRRRLALLRKLSGIEVEVRGTR